MRVMYSVEFYRDGNWHFSAAYPTLKQARSWNEYIQQHLKRRIRKWVRP